MFIRLRKADLPALDKLKLSNISVKMIESKNKLSFEAKQKTNIMKNCFSKITFDWYNNLPLAMRRISPKTCSQNCNKKHFWNELITDSTVPELNS